MKQNDLLKAIEETMAEHGVPQKVVIDYGQYSFSAYLRDNEPMIVKKSDERSHQNLSLQKEHAPYLSSSWSEAIERAFGSVNNQFLDFLYEMSCEEPHSALPLAARKQSIAQELNDVQ